LSMNNNLSDVARKGRTLLWLALAIGTLVALLVQGPRLADPYSVEEDFRNFYWMHRFQDSQLFEDDPLIRYRIVEYDVGPVHLIFDSGSPGYSLLFQLASYLMPVALVSKLLVFPLLWAAIYFSFALLRYANGRPQR
jgi:hypothetical protein